MPCRSGMNEAGRPSMWLWAVRHPGEDTTRQMIPLWMLFSTGCLQKGLTPQSAAPVPQCMFPKAKLSLNELHFVSPR